MNKIWKAQEKNIYDKLSIVGKKWFDDNCIHITKEHVDWLFRAYWYNLHNESVLPQPYTLYMPEGYILMEWDFGDYQLDLRINLVTHKAILFYEIKSKPTWYENWYDLDDRSHWDMLNDKIKYYNLLTDKKYDWFYQRNLAKEKNNED